MNDTTHPERGGPSIAAKQILNVHLLRDIVDSLFIMVGLASLLNKIRMSVHSVTSLTASSSWSAVRKWCTSWLD